MKRVLALLIAFVITLGTIMTVNIYTVSAADDSVINLLSALGVMEGDEVTGNFWNDAPVKRYEIAKILYNLYGFNGTIGETRKFTDVSDEDRVFVETIVEYGLMNGYDNETFGPEDYITNDQLVKIFVDIIGGKELAGVLGGFPVGYREAGRKLHMYNELNGSGDDAARRIDVANLIYSALHMDMVKVASYSSNNVTNYFIDKGCNFLSEQLDILIIEDVVKKIDSTAFNKPEGASEGRIQIGDMTIKDERFEADKFLGCSVVAYVKIPEDMNIGTLVYIEEAHENTIVEITGEEYAGYDANSISYYNGNKLKKMTTTSVTDMIFNGVSVKYDPSLLEKSLDDVINKTPNPEKSTSDMHIRLIDNNGDGKCDLVNVYKYNNYVINRYIAEDDMIYLKYDARPISLDDTYLRIYCDGEIMNKEDIISGAVVSYAISANDGKKALTLRLSTNSVIGNIESLKTENAETYVVIAGKEYKVNKYAKALSDGGKITDIVPGLNGQFFLNENSEIVYISGTTNIGDVGFLYGVATDGVFNSRIRFKIYTLAGKFEIFEQDKKIRVNGTSKSVETFVSEDLATLESKIVGQQLIKYKADNGVIKEINYSTDVGYNEQDFSLDAKYEDGIKITRANVFDEKYLMTADTKVFYVPSDLSDDETEYAIYTNSHFSATLKYNVWLYDITKTGKISYVLERWNVAAPNIRMGAGLMIVTNMGAALTSEGEHGYFVEGYSNTGAEVHLIVSTDDKLKDTDNSSYKVRVGDVIQYSTNIKGEVQGLKVIGEVGSTTYYGSDKSEHGGDEDFVKRHGFATNIDESGLLMTDEPKTDEINPTEAIAYLNGSGGTVYMYHGNRDIVEKAKFSDIVQGDEIFAVTNRSNNTRILVIYRERSEN